MGALPDIVKKIRSPFSNVNPETVIVLILFVLSILLSASRILPGYDEINPFDGAKYVESGRQLIDGGELREISRSPTLALIYAGIYVFVRNSLDWFVLSAGIGNLILYTLLWFTAYFLGLRFKNHFSPLILVGVIFISPAPVIILGNPSDALFAVFSAIALAKTIDFTRTLQWQDVAWASIFIGLGFVTRLDGLYQFPLFTVLTLITGFRKIKLARLITAVLLPAVVIIAAFHLASGFTRGNFNANFGGIAYASLQWYGTTDASGTLIGGEEVIETFGTPQETGGSALTAFMRNPSAVMDKIIENLKKMPDQVLSDYGGKKISPYFLLFVLVGIVALFRKKQYGLLLIFALWSLNVGLYLPYYTRSGYYLHFYFILFILCAIGVRYTFSSQRTRYEKWAALLLLSTLFIYSILDQKPAFVSVAVLSIGLLLIYWLSQSINPTQTISEGAGLFAALCIGLILRPSFSFPQPWDVGSTPQERAVHFLQTRLDRGDVVGSYVPKPVVAARMTEARLYGVAIKDDPVSDLQAWITANNVSGFIVEPNFINSYPEIWNAIELSIGTSIELEMIFDPGSTQIFIVKK